MALRISELDSFAGQYPGVGPDDSAIIPVVQDGKTWAAALSSVLKDLRVRVPLEYTTYLEQNAQLIDEDLFGSFRPAIATGQSLSSGSPLNITIGLGHVVFVVNAGSDFSGTITESGTTVPHTNTNTEQTGQTEDIVLTGLTTDNSITDAQGNIVPLFDRAYMTTKLFKGAITISTTDVNLSDVDIYTLFTTHMIPAGEHRVDAVEFIARTTNANAWAYAYLIGIEQDTELRTVDSTLLASVSIPVADTEAGRTFVGLIENINFDVISAHGFYLKLFLGPDANAYWRDITIRVETSRLIPVENV